MTKNQKKTIEERVAKTAGGTIGEVIEEEIGWLVAPTRYHRDVMVEVRERILSLISDIVREIVGEDEKDSATVVSGKRVDVIWRELTVGYNKAKQEIRQRARELGIKI